MLQGQSKNDVIVSGKTGSP